MLNTTENSRHGDTLPSTQTCATSVQRTIVCRAKTYEVRNICACRTCIGCFPLHKYRASALTCTISTIIHVKAIFCYCGREIISVLYTNHPAPGPACPNQIWKYPYLYCVLLILYKEKCFWTGIHCSRYSSASSMYKLLYITVNHDDWGCQPLERD